MTYVCTVICRTLQFVRCSGFSYSNTFSNYASHKIMNLPHALSCQDQQDNYSKKGSVKFFVMLCYFHRWLDWTWHPGRYSSGYGRSSSLGWDGICKPQMSKT